MRFLLVVMSSREASEGVVNRIVGIKNISINEPYFQGHFPIQPIMPGVLQLEAIAQVAGILRNAIAPSCTTRTW